MTMEVKTTLLPGQNGTKELVHKYGDQLACVRYRYDKVQQKKYKTIELIIDERDWIPDEIIPTGKRVLIQVGINEKTLREKVKTAGGYWDPDQKAWNLTYGKALELKITKRIVGAEKT